MNIQEEHNKRVTFDMMDGLEQKIDKLMAMIGKAVKKDEGQNRQFNPWVYQSNGGRRQTRCNYEQRGFHDRFRSDNNMNNTYRGWPRYGQNGQGRSRYDSNYRGNYGNNMRGGERYGRQNYNRNRFGEILETITMKETGVGHMIGKLEVIIEWTIEVSVTVYQGQVQGWVQSEIGLDVLSVRSFCKRLANNTSA